MGHWGNKKAVDKTEKQRRIRTVVEWIIQGYSTSDIIRQCSSLWGITNRMAYNYNKWAIEELKKNNDKKLEERKSIHVEMRLKLFRDLKKKETATGARAAVRIADSIARIEGVMGTRDNAGLGSFEEYGNSIDDNAIAIMVLPNGKEIEL